MNQHPGLSDVSQPPSLDGLSSGERVEAMVDWFNGNFEDPANETPYNGREGGYLFIHGGPFDAEDELVSAFPEAEPEEIEEARDELNSNVIDWAPAGHRVLPPDWEDEREPAPPPPLAERLEALTGQLLEVERHVVRLVEIQEEARRDTVREVGPGHNNPPEGMDDVPDLAGLRDSIAEVQSELRQLDPLTQADPNVVARAESRLAAFVKWIGGGAVTLAWEGTKGAAKALGGAGGIALLAYLSGIDSGQLLTTATAALHTIAAWASVLRHLF